MSLCIWLPLTGHLNNQGISSITVSNLNATVASDGKLGQCYNFNGSSSRIYNDNVSLSNDAMSGTCWVKLSALTRGYLFSLGGNSSVTGAYQQIGIWLETNGHPWVCGMGSELDSGYTLTTNKWYHVCMTYSGSTSKLYIDGLLVFTGTNKNTKQTRTKFCVGARSNTDTGASAGISLPLNGKLNDVRIYDHCLSPKEVEILSHGLLIHYPLGNNGSGCENKLKNSNFLQGPTGLDGYVANSGTTCTKQDDCMKIVGTQTTSGIYTSNYDTIATDTMTTFSAYVKSDSNMTIYIGTDGSGTGNCKEYSIGTSWEKISISKAKTTNNANLRIYGKGTFYAKQLKYELGSIPTPWLPNSSDTAYTSMGYNSTTEFDVSGYGYHGTRINSPTFSSDTPRYSVSTHFDPGSNTAATASYIQLPALTLDFTKISFSIWGKWDTARNWSRAWEFGEKQEGKGYDLTLGAGGNGTTLSVGGRISGSALPDTSVQTISLATWYHIVTTVDDTTCKTYVNGSLVKTFTFNSAFSTATPMNYNYIGRSNWSGNQYLNGNMSDFRVYTTVLSAQDVLDLYNKTMH